MKDKRFNDRIALLPDDIRPWIDFKIKKIEPNLCTHIVFAFFNVSDKYEIIETAGVKETLEKLIELKAGNKNLKIMFSVGGKMDCLRSQMKLN